MKDDQASKTDGLRPSARPACSHSETEFIGYDFDTVFKRCTSCGAVMASQGNFALKVPRED